MITFNSFHICRVYFLGGEKHWRGTWYDVELDVWGECEEIPPPGPLAATVALHDNL